jgi:hypothetical protein
LVAGSGVENREIIVRLGVLRLEINHLGEPFFRPGQIPLFQFQPPRRLSVGG